MTINYLSPNFNIETMKRMCAIDMGVPINIPL